MYFEFRPEKHFLFWLGNFQEHFCLVCFDLILASHFRRKNVFVFLIGNFSGLRLLSVFCVPASHHHHPFQSHQDSSILSVVDWEIFGLITDYCIFGVRLHSGFVVWAQKVFFILSQNMSWNLIFNLPLLFRVALSLLINVQLFWNHSILNIQSTSTILYLQTYTLNTFIIEIKSFWKWFEIIILYLTSILIKRMRHSHYKRGIKLWLNEGQDWNYFEKTQSIKVRLFSISLWDNNKTPSLRWPKQKQK